MRKQFILWSFTQSQKIYMKFRSKKSWNISTEELLDFPEASFGNELGNFLQVNDFELIPKGERHDAFHVLTGYGTEVEDEIAMQFLCFGNGKRGFYLYSSLLAGILILPEYLSYYIKSYRLGKNCNTFYHFNYKNLLNYSLQELREVIFNKEELSLVVNINHQ